MFLSSSLCFITDTVFCPRRSASSPSTAYCQSCLEFGHTYEKHIYDDMMRPVPYCVFCRTRKQLITRPVASAVVSVTASVLPRLVYTRARAHTVRLLTTVCLANACVFLPPSAPSSVSLLVRVAPLADQHALTDCQKKRTRWCSNVLQGKHCPYSPCQFAHSRAELVCPYCVVRGHGLDECASVGLHCDLCGGKGTHALPITRCSCPSLFFPPLLVWSRLHYSLRLSYPSASVYVLPSVPLITCGFVVIPATRE